MEDSVGSYPAEARNCCEQGERETSAWECAQAPESKPMEWTDEKHSLYLKSMEATFVNHLYKLLSQQSHRNFLPGSKLSRHKPTGIGAPSGQYKVCRYGSWSKINFVREEPEVNQVEESGALLANPWIRHYRSSERKVNRKISTSSAKTTAANQSSADNFFQLCRGDSEDENTEVTDQNFNDEDLEEDQEIKKMGIPTGTVSTTDQVVPFENTMEDNDADDHGQTEG